MRYNLSVACAVLVLSALIGCTTVRNSEVQSRGAKERPRFIYHGGDHGPSEWIIALWSDGSVLWGGSDEFDTSVFHRKADPQQIQLIEKYFGQLVRDQEAGVAFVVPDATVSRLVTSDGGRQWVASWDEKVLPAWGAAVTNPVKLAEFVAKWAPTTVSMVALSGGKSEEVTEGHTGPLQRAGVSNTRELFDSRWYMSED